MKEYANEDLEIQRVRQMLAQGFDDTNVGDGTITICEKSHSVTELIDEISSMATSDCLEEAESSKSHNPHDLDDSDLRIMKTNEKENVLPLDLWSPHYIRTMTSLTYELCGFFCEHERIEAYRVNDRQININYESNIDHDAGIISDTLKAKTNEPSLDLSIYLASEKH